MCGEKCEKSGKNPPFGVRALAKVTGFNGKVTAATVKWGEGAAEVTGVHFRITPLGWY